MNANELFEIVMDVPKAAWPKGLKFIGSRWCTNLGIRGRMKTHYPIAPEQAALMFEASMMRELLAATESVELEPPFMARTGFVVFTAVASEEEDVVYKKSGEGPLLNALAAACKAVLP